MADQSKAFGVTADQLAAAGVSWKSLWPFIQDIMPYCLKFLSGGYETGRMAPAALQWDAAHKAEAAQVGFSSSQIAAFEAAGVDWPKLFDFFKTVILPIILTFLSKSPAPVVPPVQS